MSIDEILDIIQDEACQADECAAEACKRSKYSVQDYHLCVEFYLQRLHDRIAREAGLGRRCPRFPFRQQVSQFRKNVRRSC